MRRRRRLLRAGLLIAGLFLLFLCIPVPKFDDPYSTVLTASNGELLGAHIAADGQWRFPATNTYSEKYMACVLEYEDQQFFLHWGFNPISFCQALVENIKAGHVVRGGSTISMQVVRLARHNKPRTYWEKMLEVVLALRLELHYSKQSIMNLYAAHAPFGGNVVGIDAAAWRYFHTTPDRLTWSEAATLAVLPNSPSMIHPGKERERLLDKRDALLLRMTTSKAYIPRRYHVPELTYDDYELAIMERLPDKPYDMPMLAYHYMMEQEKKHTGEQIHSGIDINLQKNVNRIMGQHYKVNSQNQVENAAVYVYDYLNDKIVAYAGNNMEARDAAMINMVKSNRSTGSIMKPFLFAAMLDEGTLLPTMLLPDIPMNLSGYTPKNYSGQYWGVVPADEALQNSLNAPFVYLLKIYGHQRFHALLKRLNISGIVFDSDHYGLSLIVGGAEASLYDLVNAYGRMGKELATGEDVSPYTPEAIAITFNVMKGLSRPSNQTGWSGFSSSKQLAWKTGTSFGFRDAWAIGLTDRYVVGVWVGNADGEGRPGLTGISTAAPLLFDVAAVLNDSYTRPAATSESIEVEVCAVSGYPSTELCKHTKKVIMPDVEIKTGPCPYHKKIFLDSTRQYQVLPDCYPVDQKCYDIYFVLPPVLEWFYKKHSVMYKPLPLLYPRCASAHPDELMAFVYPKSDARVTIPIGIKGDRQQVVFEIAHRNPGKIIYWTLNDTYLGQTRWVHQMPIDVEKGSYVLRCVDEDGVELSRKIVVN
ncbi:MAG: penicillin-binding protein 1C [Bacteroidales bacterium]|nr:penicillin-binding protein 1C [Bacteroidales bacterium]